MESRQPSSAIVPAEAVASPLAPPLPPSPPAPVISIQNAPFSRSAQLVTLLIIALAVFLLGGLAVLNGHLMPSAPPAVDARLDLNQASRADLALLPGIGPTLAERIEKHRETAGPFRSVDDLLEVPGIGRATVERIRDRVFVSGDPPPAAERRAPPLNKKAAVAAGPVDPNTATLVELDTLPGIGPKLAQRIIDERTTRPFATVDELRRVKGIGPKTLEKMRPHVAIAAREAGKMTEARRKD